MPIIKYGGFFLCKQLDDRKDNFCENISMTLNDWMAFAGVSNFQASHLENKQGCQISGGEGVKIYLKIIKNL